MHVITHFLLYVPLVTSFLDIGRLGHHPKSIGAIVWSQSRPVGPAISNREEVSPEKMVLALTVDFEGVVQNLEAFSTKGTAIRSGKKATVTTAAAT